MSARARDIELLALDVDGVLTDGSILIDADGRETKQFNVRDGQGIVAWHRAGFLTAIISGRSAPAVEHRARELGIRFVIQGSRNKCESLEEVSRRTGVALARTAFLGDDEPDLPAMARVGYPMAVADAEPGVLAAAAHVTRRPGGRGAVRDAVEHLLAARGLSPPGL